VNLAYLCWVIKIKDMKTFDGKTTHYVPDMINSCKLIGAKPEYINSDGGGEIRLTPNEFNALYNNGMINGGTDSPMFSDINWIHRTINRRNRPQFLNLSVERKTASIKRNSVFNLTA
jgi:hypothetical protein